MEVSVTWEYDNWRSQHIKEGFQDKVSKAGASRQRRLAILDQIDLERQ